MFTVKKVPRVECHCPKGHTLPPDLFPQSSYSVRFCSICGMPTEEKQITYDAAFCANCNNPVDPTWNYCQYCGQGREDRA